MARRLGVKSDLRPEYGLALGVSEVSALELTSAFAVLGNQGLRVPPTGIRRVMGANGELLEVADRAGERALPEEIAFMLTSVLQGAVERGTAKRGRVPGRNVAAKTGTSQEAVDMWFVGYTPKLATGLWVGYDQPRSVGSHETAGRLAAPVWADFMRRALQGMPNETVPIPEGILPLRVNYKTGQPTHPSDPAGITEYFVRGTLPEREAPPWWAPAAPSEPPAAGAPSARPPAPPPSVSPEARPPAPPPVTARPPAPRGLPPPPAPLPSLSRSPLAPPRSPSPPIAPTPNGTSNR
jgi:penicillin-binding protein 1A